MKFYNRPFNAFVFLLACGMSHCARSLELRELSLDEKVASSEIVMIGSVKKIIKNTQDFGYDLAITVPTTVLKGTPPKEIKFAFNGSISEMHSDCCETGKSYLFFISKNTDGDYNSVNGRYGVYSLGK